MTLHPGQNSNSWQPAWNNGKTRTIRVPVRLADDILAYARALDSGIPVENLIVLQAIDDFVELRLAEFQPNQHSRTASTTSRRWDELRRFKNLVATGFDRSMCKLTTKKKVTVESPWETVHP